MDIYKDNRTKIQDIGDEVPQRPQKVNDSGQDKECDHTDQVECKATRRESAEVQANSNWEEHRSRMYVPYEFMRLNLRNVGEAEQVQFR